MESFFKGLTEKKRSTYCAVKLQSFTGGFRLQAFFLTEYLLCLTTKTASKRCETLDFLSNAPSSFMPQEPDPTDLKRGSLVFVERALDNDKLYITCILRQWTRKQLRVYQEQTAIMKVVAFVNDQSVMAFLFDFVVWKSC